MAPVKQADEGERGVFDLDYFRGSTGFAPAVGETVTYLGLRWRVTSVEGFEIHAERIP